MLRAMLVSNIIFTEISFIRLTNQSIMPNKLPRSVLLNIIWNADGYLKDIENLLCSIFLLETGTFLLNLIRMNIQCCLSVNLFNRGRGNHVCQRHWLPTTFRPKHLFYHSKDKYFHLFFWRMKLGTSNTKLLRTQESMRS